MLMKTSVLATSITTTHTSSRVMAEDITVPLPLAVKTLVGNGAGLLESRNFLPQVKKGIKIINVLVRTYLQTCETTLSAVGKTT